MRRVEPAAPSSSTNLTPPRSPATFFASSYAHPPAPTSPGVPPTSFTYGPPPYDREDQNSLNNLPRMFKLVAESLGRPVLIGEDTIGGCTLYMHRPSVNPEACDTTADDASCELVDGYRVNGTRHCTVAAGIDIDDDNYHPCPQVTKGTAPRLFPRSAPFSHFTTPHASLADLVLVAQPRLSAITLTLFSPMNTRLNSTLNPHPCPHPHPHA